MSWSWISPRGSIAEMQIDNGIYSSSPQIPMMELQLKSVKFPIMLKFLLKMVNKLSVMRRFLLRKKQHRLCLERYPYFGAKIDHHAKLLTSRHVSPPISSASQLPTPDSPVPLTQPQGRKRFQSSCPAPALTHRSSALPSLQRGPPSPGLSRN